MLSTLKTLPGHRNRNNPGTILPNTPNSGVLLPSEMIMARTVNAAAPHCQRAVRRLASPNTARGSVSEPR